MTILSVLGLFWQPDSSTAVLNAEGLKRACYGGGVC